MEEIGRNLWNVPKLLVRESFTLTWAPFEEFQVDEAVEHLEKTIEAGSVAAIEQPDSKGDGDAGKLPHSTRPSACPV
jgi:hypothetical protein